MEFPFTISNDQAKQKNWLYLSGFALVCAIIGVLNNNVLFITAPLYILGALTIVFLKGSSLYFAYFLLMPISVEVFLPGGLGTDLPTEPFMWLCTVYLTFLFFYKIDDVNFLIPKNGITGLLLIHIVWIFITMFGSQSFFISFKWFCAKLWYIIPFYFGTYYFLYEEANFEKAIKLTFWPLLGAVIFVMYRHYGYDFSFDTANKVVVPIFRNHVNYASALVLFIPFIAYLYKHDANKSLKPIYAVSIAIFVVGVYFSYTRAAILCLVIGLAAYYLIKWRLLAHTIIVSFLLLAGLIYYLVHDNNYVDYAPDYNKTVSHTDFNNLIDATTKLEDISTMERVYRWVAGCHMIVEKPIGGFGPGTFYSQYKKYTLKSFRTYVSGNPEKSGIHSYYLMTAVEQGLVGLAIFLLFILVTLHVGEFTYHNSTSARQKDIVMSAIVCIIIILSINLINDTLEVDKIGPYFFMCCAMIGIQRYKLNQV